MQLTTVQVTYPIAPALFLTATVHELVAFLSFACSWNLVKMKAMRTAFYHICVSPFPYELPLNSQSCIAQEATCKLMHVQILQDLFQAMQLSD